MKSRSSRTCQARRRRSARLLDPRGQDWKGVSEETTTGVHRLYQIAEGQAAGPAINVNDSVTKSKFDNLYGCRESLADGILRATDVMLAGKVAVVCGYGDVGKGLRRPSRGLRRPRDRHRDRPDLRPAGGDGRLRGHHHRGHPRPTADIYVTTTGNKDVIITLEHMQAMKDQAIVCNIGHFDNEIQVDALNASGAVGPTSPQVDKFPAPGGKMIFLLAEGPPGEPRLRHRPPELRDEQQSFTNQTLAQIDLWANKDVYEAKVYIRPSSWTRKWRACTWEDRREAPALRVEGPYKPEHYRYRSPGSTAI